MVNSKLIFDISCLIFFSSLSGGIVATISSNERSNWPVVPSNAFVGRNQFSSSFYNNYRQNQILDHNFKNEQHQNKGQNLDNKSNLALLASSRPPKVPTQRSRTMPLTARHEVASMLLHRHELKKPRFTSSEAAPVNKHKFDVGKSRLSKMSRNSEEMRKVVENNVQKSSSFEHGTSPQTSPNAKSKHPNLSPLYPKGSKPIGKSASSDSVINQQNGVTSRQNSTTIARASSLDSAKKGMKKVSSWDGGLAGRMMEGMLSDFDFAKVKGKKKMQF